MDDLCGAKGGRGMKMTTHFAEVLPSTCLERLPRHEDVSST